VPKHLQPLELATSETNSDHEVALMPLANAASYTRQRHDRFIFVVSCPMGMHGKTNLLAMQLPALLVAARKHS